MSSNQTSAMPNNLSIKTLLQYYETFVIVLGFKYEKIATKFWQHFHISFFNIEPVSLTFMQSKEIPIKL